MPNLNRVMLMGNLTRDPELRYLPNGNTALTKLGLAINRRWRNQQGEQQEETTFVDCEAWGRTAELLNQYLKKGRPVYLEGRLRLDQWKDKEGQNRSKLVVVVESFQFIDSRGGEGGGSQEGGFDAGRNEGGYGGGSSRQSATPARPRSAPAGAAPNPPPPADEVHHPVEEDDIPF